MKQLRMSAHFEAPIEHVFELGTDYRRWPEWNTVYTDVGDVTGPPDAVGTRVHGVMKFLGRTMDGWSEVKEADPPRMIRLAGESTQGGSLGYVFRLTPAGTGTDIELETEYELPAGLFGQVADKLFLERAVERQLRHAIENFKDLVEASSPVLA